MYRKLASKIFPLSVKLLNNFRILKEEFGYLKSIRHKKPVDKNLTAIPWYTYPAIEYLSQFDYSDHEILEFGLGNSSIFWAERCKSITCIEHRKEWFDKIILEVKSGNANLLLRDENQYTEICNGERKFDLVIIDGIKRTECAKNIHKCLNLESGFVIFDNSDWYPETSKYLREELGLIQIDFFGFGPINNYTWCTSVFFSQGTKLKPLSRQPVSGIGALKQISDND